jgi:hypothetical protein
MLSVAVPIVRGEGARNLIPIRQLAPGAKPPAGQLLLAIWNVTPLVVPVTLAVIGPVEPDPAGPTLVSVFVLATSHRDRRYGDSGLPEDMGSPR